MIKVALIETDASYRKINAIVCFVIFDKRPRKPSSKNQIDQKGYYKRKVPKILMKKVLVLESFGNISLAR